MYQFVGQGGVEIGCFARYAEACLVVRSILDLAHHVDAVGYHDEDDAHVLGKGEEQLAEVFRLNAGAFPVKFLHADEAPDNSCHVFAKFLSDGFGRISAVAHGVVQHHAQDGCAAHTYLFGHDNGRLHVLEDGIQPEDIARDGVGLDGVYEVGFQSSAISLLQGIAGELQQFAVEADELCQLLGGEECICFHNCRF